jgi:hypothetical protein
VKRRSIAPLIRARQELWKRVERLSSARRWSGVQDTLAVLDRRAVGGGGVGSLETIGRTLRANARTRYPVAHLLTRDPRSLPDAAAVLAEAEQFLGGDWKPLGAAVRVTANSVAWRTHPVSLVPTPDRHFSRVSYAADVLGGDVKYLWEMNRHAELVRLAQGYWLTRRPEFAHAAVSLIESWIEQNPPGIGINWISAVDVSFRTIAWCWVWTLTADCDAWTDERVGRLLWAVAQCGRFIARYDSVHHSPNTHLTGEALGLVYIGSVFPELRSATRWRALGMNILTEEVPHQFLDDGMHYERCTGYHRYHLEFYLHALAIARAHRETWAEMFREPLRRGAHVSLQLRRPDGTWPVFGDEDGGATVRLGTRDVTDQNELLAVAAGLLEQPELRTAAGRDATSVGWWMLDTDAWARITSDAGSGLSLPPSASLSASGYYVARDDWSETAWYCAVDAGPHGGDATGHAHTDLGHVEIARGSQWIIVDPGCPVYTSAPDRRDWFRGQRAHATIMVDGVELAEPSSAFGWRTVAPTPLVETADEGGYWYCRLRYSYPTANGPVEHERQVVLVRSWGVIVCDLLDGAGSHAVVARWPIGVRQADVQMGSAGGEVVFHGCRVHWHTSGLERVGASIEPTTRSPRFGVEVDASALVLSATAAALPGRVVTTFTSAETATPVIEETPDGMRVKFERPKAEGPTALLFRVGVAPSRSGAEN